MPIPLGRRAACAAAILIPFLIPSSQLAGQRAPASGTAAPRPAARAASSAAPKLAVILVVDQMRADYVDRFQSDWTGGLKRMVSEGARFTETAYPYLMTFTCAGHATIATGAFPHTHGILQNTWYDAKRNERDVIQCTDDGVAAPIAYTGKADADGPGNLLVPAFADEMRAQKSSRVVSLALKARSAIMLAGHGGDAVTWMQDDAEGWQTSTAYAKGPVPAVKAFFDAHPIEKDLNAVWQRMLPPTRYPEVDDGFAEAPPRGWTATFPHELKGSGSADRRYRDQWQHSPFADDYVGQMAIHLVEQLKLGQQQTTDVLAVSFSSPDLVGHQFGPESQEVRDMYARLDRTIGLLLTRLDTLVGRGQYVVGLSADHGVWPIPEQLVRRGLSAGRVAAVPIRETVEQTLAAAFGPGSYVARVNRNDIYLKPGVYQRVVNTPGVLEKVYQAVLKIEGIQRVLRPEQVANQVDSPEPDVRAAAFSYVPGRSGDLILILRPGWMFSENGTTHGSNTPDDQRVPLLFYGKGIKPGTYRDASTPADLAPTLAAVTGIRMPKAEGRALTSALASRR